MKTYKNHKPNCVCMACKMLRGEFTGKNNPNYTTGITIGKHFCIDCGEEISNAYAERCNSCASKGERNPMFGKTGEQCPSYTHGLSSKDKHYFCACGAEICYQTALYGKGLCRACSNKEVSKQTQGRIPWNKGIPNSTGKRQLETTTNTIIKHHVDLKENSERIIEIPQGFHRSLHWRGYEYVVALGLIKEYIKEFLQEHKDAMSAEKILHHIDCNRENNQLDNFLYLASKAIHNQLHQEAYGYLVKKGMIDNYIAWFFSQEENSTTINVKGGHTS
jgi:hypothetical protein